MHDVSFPKQDAFGHLVQAINEEIRATSGEDSKKMNKDRIMKLMGEYKSDVAHWDDYAIPDPKKTVTRNLIDTCNGKSDLLLLVWTPGEKSPIHDHAGSHCVMKILRGSLTETRFNWPDKATAGTIESKGLQMTKETTYRQDEVAYMADDLGLHKISTAKDTDEFAVSLHLYAPPNAAFHGFSTFDEETGAEHRITEYSYDSMLGKRVPATDSSSMNSYLRLLGP